MIRLTFQPLGFYIFLHYGIIKLHHIIQNTIGRFLDSPYKNLNSKLIYDTSGLKPKVKENNPKTLVSEINRQKAYAKATNKESFNPYAAAYKNMPKYTEANKNIKLDFVNGHFEYFYKLGVITNGLCILLKIHFFEDDFYDTLAQDFDTPEKQKYHYDNASLKPVVVHFLNSVYSYTNFIFTTFLGDSEFDSYDSFGLLKELQFKKVLIHLNPRNQKNNKLNDLEFNCEGIPLCPLNKEEFKAEGPCKGKTEFFVLNLPVLNLIEIKKANVITHVRNHVLIRKVDV